MKSHAYATCAVALAVVGTTRSAISAEISPNPHQVARIVETDTDGTLSDFANLGVLRKRGEGTLSLSAPADQLPRKDFKRRAASVMAAAAATSAKLGWKGKV